jgi:hypothetical protein
MENDQSILALEAEKLKDEEKLRRQIINFAKEKLGKLLTRAERFDQDKQKFSVAFSNVESMTPMECVKFHAMCGCADCKESLEREGIKVNAVFGLVKGQHVSRHARIDPRTGQHFVAGGKASGSPETVLAEHKTSASIGGSGGGGKPSTGKHNMLKTPTAVDGPGTDAGAGISGDIMEKQGTIYDPDMLETVIRNLENAKVADLQSMTNDLFMQPRCMQRGIIAELMLKEIMRRGIVEKSETENAMDSVKQEGKDMQLKAKEDQAKSKAKEAADKPKPKPGASSK